jgi:ADP-L-glycero-D-manno-heptose 6-epimerase
VTRGVLVTGAAGFVGGHLARACRRRGWAVTAVDRRAAPTRPGRDEPGPDYEIIRGHAASPAVLARVARGEYFAVLHNAGISDTGESSWDRLASSNVDMPLRLAAACAASGTRLIYASSGSVYGAISSSQPVPEHAVASRDWCSGPLNLYARSKLVLEQKMADQFPAASWVGLRYTNVFGTGEEHKGRMACILTQLLRKTARGGQVTLFRDTLRAARDYIPVSCLAETIFTMLAHDLPSGVYNLGSGHATSFAEALQWCAELRGNQPLTVRLIPNPVSARYQYWTCADMTLLRTALPSVPRISADQLRHAAAELYGTFPLGAR